jgi:hypothetical protein
MHDLTLCIINDGRVYRDRFRVARTVARMSPVRRFQAYSSLIFFEADWYARRWNLPPFEFAELATVLTELDDYYQQHLAELDPAP